MQEEACRHTLSALHTMLRHAVHRALYQAHSTIVCLTREAHWRPHRSASGPMVDSQLHPAPTSHSPTPSEHNCEVRLGERAGCDS